MTHPTHNSHNQPDSTALLRIDSVKYPACAALLRIISASKTPLHAPRINDLMQLYGFNLTPDTLKDKLAHLVRSGRLIHTGRHDTSAWAIKPARPSHLVAAPTPNPMGQPTYKPVQTYPHRPGSLDYKRCASVGVPC